VRRKRQRQYKDLEIRGKQVRHLLARYALVLINACALSINSTLLADSKDSLRIEALRCSSEIKIDDILSEHEWRCLGFTKFAERDPNEGTKPSSYDFNLYGENGSRITEEDGTYQVDPGGQGTVFAFSDPNFNYRYLHADVILRWEYTHGSTLYLVWTQDRTDALFPGSMEINCDLRSLISAPPDNIFLVKFTYWFNI